MVAEFRMPSLGPDMESGTLVAWRTHPGASVERGDVIALVETDKGVIDVEVFESGTVEKLLVEPGTRVPVGTVLARLSGAEPQTPLTSLVLPPQPEAKAVVAAQKVPAGAPSGRQKISPAARVRARELGIDVSKVPGSGAGGVITLEDVVSYAASAATKMPAAESAYDMRQVIARAMSRSKREIPHYYLSLTCSFTAARAFLERHNQSVSVEQRLLPSALLVKAVALAAHSMPEFNGFYMDGVFSPSASVNVGMAIAARGGRLVAPAILDVDRKTLQTVMSELRDLTTRVRTGHMRANELAAPTITVTSLAEEGVDLIVPAIYPPQVAIVGFGSILERPWIVEGVVQPAPVLTMTLAADHRVTDGRAGARFLAQIRDVLQGPQSL